MTNWTGVVLALLIPAAGWAQQPAAGFAGTWQGTLDVGPIKIRLGLHITRNGAGAYSATVDNIDQAVTGIAVQSIRVSGELLHLNMADLGASFDGQLSEDGKRIEGEFTQVAEFPLVFQRVVRVDQLKRPQQPRGPVPYLSTSVTYQNQNVKLAGTLTRPMGAGPFPAVLIVSGAGAQDRDGTVAGHKPFLVIADYLARRGVAVLRVDDRGVGGSSGDSEDAGLEELTSDALAGLAFLRARKEIDAKGVGIVGYSEGAQVGALAATKSADVAYLAMLASSGIPGDEAMFLQGETIARASGASEPAIQESRELQKKMVEILRAEPDQFAAIEKIREAWAESRVTLPAAIRSQVDAQIISAASPGIRSFLLHDPTDVLQMLKIPVLALHGSRDVQTPPAQNIPAIVEALNQAGNSNFTVSELPGLNHLFQTCSGCTVTEYSSLEETFSPDALRVLSDWILRLRPTARSGASPR